MKDTKGIKEKIKSLIVKIPGIRGFMVKWIQARFAIMELERRNQEQENKINELQSSVMRLTETINQGYLQGDFHHVRMLQSGQKRVYEKINQSQKDAAQSLVSIIISNRNGKEKLEKLMQSFYERKFYRNIEIVFIDNDSEDDSAAYMESWSGQFTVTVIRNNRNLSFSAANNKGAKYAKGAYLLFLNNDTQVTDGWLDELLKTYQQADHPGAVGAKLIYPKVPDYTINAGKSYCIQHNGIAFRDAVQEEQYYIQPYNRDNGQGDLEWGTETVACAGVTAAVLLVAKSVFDEVGGFDEKYNYGYEDVDFCLKLGKAGYKNYCCQSSLVYHYEFGTQNEDNREEIKKRRIHNIEVFKGKWQTYLSRKILDDKLNGRRIFTEKKLVVALAVTEADPQTEAGDYFTAMELAGSLQKLGFEIKYLSRRGSGDWYDVGWETDVLLTMLDAYDIRKIYHAKNDLVKIAWARNWFDRWCQKEYFEQFDLVLASSKTACAYVDSHSKHRSILFPIATNHRRFYLENKYRLETGEKEKFYSDYAFTGSYWNAKRDIIDYLNPSEIPYICKIYGANWEHIEKFKDYSKGFVSYADMPKIYQNTKLVIDDANYATKVYGAVNSRVFDALASGTLVLTNGCIGAEEMFHGMLPSFSCKEELNKKLLFYLENERERIALAEKLQRVVLENHTYDLRAARLVEILKAYNADHVDERLVDICGAMPESDAKKNWGDYHYALSMQKEFVKRGYQVNIRPREQWYHKSNAKYIIVLRGSKPYYPSMSDGRKYIMWNISHPEDVTVEEYNLYDYVFFASERMKKEIGPKIHVLSDVLLQCADEEVMSYTETGRKKYELLFVGNSRGVYRSILKDLLPTKYKLSVYGEGWDGFPVEDYVVSEYLENEKLGQAYHDAEIVLNDHWEDMREYGIISNRIFDVLAAGAFVISDEIPEVAEVFAGSVVSYRGVEDLKEKVQYYMENREERERLVKKGQEIVLSGHTFAYRVDRICEVLGRI